MKTPLRLTLIAIFAVAASTIMVTASSKKTYFGAATPPNLGIEIALAKPFYIPAATGGKSIKVMVRVPLSADAEASEAVSAIKLEPKMDGDKVRVEVFALVGPTTNIKLCSDWDALKSTLVDTYVAGVDEEVTLTKLRKFGVSMASDPLTFRVVPSRTLSPLPQAQGTGGCGCGSCGSLICSRMQDTAWDAVNVETYAAPDRDR